jgi:hypothetical protein
VDRDPESRPDLIAHETVHLKQQNAMGRNKWLWKYITSRAFRLDQEGDAIIVEALSTPQRRYEYVIEDYAELLSSSTYWWAASSESAAKAVLYEKLKNATK